MTDVEERLKGEDYNMYDCIDIIPTTINAYGEEISTEELLTLI